MAVHREVQILQWSRRGDMLCSLVREQWWTLVRRQRPDSVCTACCVQNVSGLGSRKGSSALTLISPISSKYGGRPFKQVREHPVIHLRGCIKEHSAEVVIMYRPHLATESPSSCVYILRCDGCYRNIHGLTLSPIGNQPAPPRPSTEGENWWKFWVELAKSNHVKGTVHSNTRSKVVREETDEYHFAVIFPDSIPLKCIEPTHPAATAPATIYTIPRRKPPLQYGQIPQIERS